MLAKANTVMSVLENKSGFCPTQRCLGVGVGVILLTKLPHGLIHRHVVWQHCIADQELQLMIRAANREYVPYEESVQ